MKKKKKEINKQQNGYFAASYGYDQLTNFLQGYIDNELNFNDEDTCSNNCEDYTKTKNIQCANKTLCAEVDKHRDLTVCLGDVRDCVEVASIDVEVCHSNSAIRRYNYFKYSHGKFYGLKPSAERPCIAEARVSMIILMNLSLIFKEFPIL